MHGVVPAGQGLVAADFSCSNADDRLIEDFYPAVLNGLVDVVTDEAIDYKWTYINVKASNSAKFGSGLSLTYAHKNDFAWRIFCDYDYTVKTYAASYAPMKYLEDFSIDIYNWSKTDKWDTNNTWTTSTRKHLHQWVLGGALCVSF